MNVFEAGFTIGIAPGGRLVPATTTVDGGAPPECQSARLIGAITELRLHALGQRGSPLA